MTNTFPLGLIVTKVVGAKKNQRQLKFQVTWSTTFKTIIFKGAIRIYLTYNHFIVSEKLVSLLYWEIHVDKKS